MRRRPDVVRREQLRRFLRWLVGKASQDAFGSARSFRRVTAWCWELRPRLSITGEVFDTVVVDGVWIGSWCLLIAVSGTGRVIDWQWAARESQAAWQHLFARIPAPEVLVSDGGSGLRAAATTVWPDTKLQRCVFHLQMNVTRHLTRNPRTDAGKALRVITQHLSDVRDIDAAIRWQVRLHDWWNAFGHLTKERTVYVNGGFGFTHERLRKAWLILRRIARDGHAFTFLIHPCPRTTSALEGGINAPLRNLLRHHRGMREEHRRRAAEWFLYLHEHHLRDALSYANTPTETPQPTITEAPPGPELYGTATTAEEGLWTRTGWAGRP